VIYCSMTAALLWPTPGAIWLDATAAENRPGRHGVWQRPVERRRLSQAPLVLVMGERSLEPLGGAPAGSVLVPVPVEPSSAPPGARDIAAITYAGDPEKKRLDVVLAAWEHARRGDESLLVAGTDDLEPRSGIRVVGRLPGPDYRALLRRARLFVHAPRREDYGIAPLEALADGCVLVTTPAPGPYPALALARELDRRLVTDDLAAAIRMALDDPLAGYAARAHELLAPFSRPAVDRTVAEQVLPRLVGPASPG
jgi:glycosyltransferase involved in cell wall biosynthesis